MKKEKLMLEYSLKRVSENLLWTLISTPSGLSEWFAKDVSITKNMFVFSWGHSESKAYLFFKKEGRTIRFQWEEDYQSDAYFEMKILTRTLSNDVTLLITEFVNIDEKEDFVLLWNKQVELLRKKIGVGQH